jgi:hypothetical protein
MPPRSVEVRRGVTVMVINHERMKEDTATVTREPQRRAPVSHRRRLWIWVIVGFALAIVLGVGLWLLLGPAGDDAVDTEAVPAQVEAQHDAALDLAVHERIDAQHDSGLGAAGALTGPSAHDSGIEQALREAPAPSAHDSGVEQLLREGD